MYQELIINISSFFMLERMMKMENQEINYEEKIELLDEVLNSSIEFDVKKHRFLWIRQYYGNKKIYLDLSKKDKDMMEQLFIKEEKVYNDDYDIDQGW